MLNINQYQIHFSFCNWKGEKVATAWYWNNSKKEKIVSLKYTYYKKFNNWVRHMLNNNKLVEVLNSYV